MALRPPAQSFPAWMPWAIVCAVALAYANSLRAPFLFDDAGAIEHNPTIRRLASLDVLTPPADGSTTTGRPLVNLSFALNYALGGLRVEGYHATNLALHSLAALTLFGLARRTLLRPPLPARLREAAAPLAFVIGLLWALHPLQTETVVCVAQRTELLCGLCYLLTLYALVRAADEGPAAGRWRAASIAACILGMGTKEVMVTAPVLALLYDRTFLAGTFAAAWSRRRGYYVALAATWLPLAWLVAQGGGARGVAAGFGLGVSSWDYLLTQSVALLRYLRLAVWPDPLVLDYGTAVARSLAAVWWQGGVILLLLAGTGWALRRRPVAGFCGAWFFVILAPSSSVVPLVTQTIAEHRMYLPLAGLLALAVSAAHLRLGRSVVGWGGALALVWAGVTHARNADYRDALVIWSDNVRHHPASARAQHNLAWTLQQRGRSDEANVHFDHAVRLDPRYVTGHYSRGVALLEQGRPADAVAALSRAVALAPGHSDAHLNLGNALLRLRRAGEAIAHYERALALRPAADAHYNLGMALAEAGRRDDAGREFRRALELDPALVVATHQLARLAEQAGDVGAAERLYGDVLRRRPDDVDAHRRLGLLLARSDRAGAAAEHFRALLRRQPDDVEARANLGNVLLMLGQAREAIELYEAVLRLRPDDARIRENLRVARELAR